MDVGATLSPTPQNPAGIWPVSRPAGGAGAEWMSDTCNVADGTSGVLGGCILGTHQNRAFSYDQLDNDSEYWTVEARLRSTFEGPMNFLLGASQYEGRAHGAYYVLANTLDLVTLYGSAALNAPPLYPGFFMNTNNPDSGAQQEGTALFGEVYYDFSDRLQLTAGLRFNQDDKATSDTSVLFNSADANAALGGVLGPGRVWLRSGLFGEMVAIASGTATSISDSTMRMLEFWDAGGVYEANGPTAIGLVGALGAAQQIGGLLAAGLLPIELLPATLASLPLPPIFPSHRRRAAVAEPRGDCGGRGTPGRRGGVSNHRWRGRPGARVRRDPFRHRKPVHGELGQRQRPLRLRLSTIERRPAVRLLQPRLQAGRFQPGHSAGFPSLLRRSPSTRRRWIRSSSAPRRCS